MRIYHFEFPKLGSGLSGGEHCLLEIIRYFKSQGVRNVLLTTDNGRAAYEALGFHEDALLEYRTVAAARHEKRFGILISYMIRTVQALRLVRRLDLEADAVLLCNSDPFPNAIPFRALAKRYPHLRAIYWVRMLAPDIWKGYLGHYLGRFHWPTPAIVYFKLSQWLYRRLMLPHGVVLTSNPSYRPTLERQLPGMHLHVLRRYTGRPPTAPPPAAVKRYDLAWMGRFHAQKGLFEMLDIVRRLKDDHPKLSVLVIGGGDPRMVKAFHRRCQREGLTGHIDYQGYLSDHRRLILLSQAKLFLLTSYFEGYPNVVVEAMSVGLPVVAYDFPFYDPFPVGVLRCPPIDNAAMTRQITDLLRDEPRRQTLADDALRASHTYTWDQVGAEVLSLAAGTPPSTE